MQIFPIEVFPETISTASTTFQYEQYFLHAITGTTIYSAGFLLTEVEIEAICSLIAEGLLILYPCVALSSLTESQLIAWRRMVGYKAAYDWLRIPENSNSVNSNLRSVRIGPVTEQYDTSNNNSKTFRISIWGAYNSAKRQIPCIAAGLSSLKTFGYGSRRENANSDEVAIFTNVESGRACSPMVGNF